MHTLIIISMFMYYLCIGNPEVSARLYTILALIGYCVAIFKCMLAHQVPDQDPDELLQLIVYSSESDKLVENGIENGAANSV